VADQKRPLYDSATFWGVWGALAVVIGSAFVLIGASELPERNPDRWSNAWWNIGIGLLAVGVLSLLWSLILFLAHRYAEGMEWRQVRKAANDEPPTPTPPVPALAVEPPAPISDSPSRAPAVGAPKALLRERRAAMRAVLEELSAGREIIEPSIESGIIWSAWQIPQDKAWKRNRRVLLDALSVPDGECVDEAYKHVDRLSGRRGGASLAYLVGRQQLAKRINAGDRLEEAVAAIQAAEVVLAAALNQSEESVAPEPERAKAVRQEITAIKKATGEELATWKPGSAPKAIPEEPWPEAGTTGSEWSCAHRLTNQGFALRLTRPTDIDYETYLKKCVVRYHPPPRYVDSVVGASVVSAGFVVPSMIEQAPEAFPALEIGYQESRSNGPWEIEFPAHFPDAIKLLPIKPGRYTYTWIATLYPNSRGETRIVAEGTVHWKK
jgi:hypothetical protein